MGWDRRRFALLGALSAGALPAAGCSFDGSGVASGHDAAASVPDAAPVPDAFVAPCMTNPAYQARSGSEHRYRLVSEAEIYDEAQATCAADGAHLAVVDDAEENDYLRGLAEVDFWIGYHDLEVEDSFAWVTGAPVDFEMWDEGEPNDDPHEDCAEMRNGPTWNDTRCDEAQLFVCECDPSYRAPPVPDCMDEPSYGEIRRGRRYRYEDQAPGSWPDARQSCNADGGHLAVISDEDEYGAVDSILWGNNAWIGYHDRNQEDDYEWVTGSEASFELWDGGQPDDAGEGEDCIEFRGGQGWNDLECSRLVDFLCECDPGWTPAR